MKRHIQNATEVLLADVAAYEQAWPSRLEALQQRPQSILGKGFRDAVWHFIRTVVCDLPRDRILRALNTMSALGVANFAFATRPGETITVNLPDVSFSLVGVENTIYTDVDTWLDAYFAVTIARDRVGLQTLCATPQSAHERAGLKPDPFGLAFVRAIKALYDPSASMADALAEAIKTSNPEFFSGRRLHYVNHILFPQLPVYRCLLSADREEFDQRVSEALVAHRAFWEQHDFYDPGGWVSLPLLAACATALDHKGWETTVVSDYVPAWLTRVGVGA